mmetsp:Transcript_4996/g.14797  ORF Transcript_4996/g.14797 Transcript_4996/m.14797 type:complete len:300 (+) Transcript_4996:676-1575(+)
MRVLEERVAERARAGRRVHAVHDVVHGLQGLVLAVHGVVLQRVEPRRDAHEAQLALHEADDVLPGARRVLVVVRRRRLAELGEARVEGRLVEAVGARVVLGRVPRLEVLEEAHDRAGPHEAPALGRAQLGAAGEHLVLRVRLVEGERRRRELDVAAVLVGRVGVPLGPLEAVEAPVQGRVRIALRELARVAVVGQLLHAREHVVVGEPLLRLGRRHQARGPPREEGARQQGREHARERDGPPADDGKVALEELGARPRAPGARAGAAPGGAAARLGLLVLRRVLARRAEDPHGRRAHHD